MKIAIFSLSSAVLFQNAHFIKPKYKIFGKYLQLFTRYSRNEKPEVPKCQMLAANILKGYLFHRHVILMNNLFQVLGKSAKPIPVMILGIILAKKRYPAAKFLFILMIVIGVSLFLYKDQQKSTVADDKPLIGIGEILLVSTVNAFRPKQYLTV